MEEGTAEVKKGNSIWLSVGVGVASALITNFFVGHNMQKSMDELLLKINNSSNGAVTQDAGSNNAILDELNKIKVLMNEKKSNSDKQTQSVLKFAKDVKQSKSVRSMCYRNAIANNPNNVDIIKEYVKFMVDSVKTESPKSKVDTYQMLLTYLGDLSLNVQAQTIPALDILMSEMKTNIAKITVELEKTKTQKVGTNNTISEDINKRFDDLKTYIGDKKLNSEEQAKIALGFAKDVKQSKSVRTMYYVNAIANNPDNVEVIKEYVKFTVDSVKSESPKSKVDTYQMLLTYLGNLSLNVQAQTIPVLDTLMSEMKVNIDKIMDELEKDETANLSKPQNNVEIIGSAKKEWEKINSGLKTGDINKNINLVSDFLTNYSSIGDDKNFAETYESAQGTLGKLIADKQVLDLIDKCEKSISFISNENNNEHLLIEAAAIESDLNLLISQKYKVSEIYQKNIMELENKFSAFSKEMRKKINDPILKEINGKIAGIDQDTESTYEERIKRFNDIIKSVQKNKLDSEKKVEIIENITEKISDMRSKQIKEYNRWAFGVIEYVFKRIDETFVSDDKVMDALNELGEVDTSCLSSSTHSAYQTVFQFGYSKLDNDDKIRIDTRMEGRFKKELKDF